MKTVLITGSNRGIGKAMVKTFAYSGYKVLAAARNESEDFAKFLKDICGGTENGAHGFYFDLKDEDATKNAVKNIYQKGEHIDVLINNAGVAHSGLINMTSTSKLKEVYDVNVFAPVLMMQLVARQMMKQRSGCIINMCSVGGIEANPGYAAYGSSKAALVWLTRCASKEFGQYNIRVNGIAPGLIDTDMGHTKSEDEINKVMDRMSIKRMGMPEEIAKLALFLASEDAGFITGQIFVADGGRV